MSAKTDFLILVMPVKLLFNVKNAIFYVKIVEELKQTSVLLAEKDIIYNKDSVKSAFKTVKVVLVFHNARLVKQIITNLIRTEYVN